MLLNWLHEVGSTQTPRAELIKELLDRYSSLESCPQMFKDFCFEAKIPEIELIL